MAKQCHLLLTALVYATAVLAWPQYMANGSYLRSLPKLQAEHVLSNISIPARPSIPLGLSKIPSPAHPYIAPQPSDERGPCPGMNTLANHGYIPRNGIATFSQIVEGCMQGYNMDYDLVSMVAAFSMLIRGNPLLDRLSIGGESRLVPAIPGFADGMPGGLSKHGRFEGDASMVHEDHGIETGSASFQEHLFQKFIEFSRTYSDGQLITRRVMQEVKRFNWVNSRTNNPTFVLKFIRMTAAYNEAAFLPTFFANGTNAELSISTARSFLQHNRFPDNWYRRSSPANFSTTAAENKAIMAPYPITPGRVNATGHYVPDDISRYPPGLCGAYVGFLGEIPEAYTSVTGRLRANVDVLLDILHRPFPADCPPGLPVGTNGV